MRARATSIAELRAGQQLNQEQATFEQRLRQDAQWFKVRQAVGYGAVMGLLAILGGSGYLVLSDNYGPKVTAAAVSAVFSTMLTLFVGVWKVALKGAPSGPTEPTTTLALPDQKRGAPRTPSPVRRSPPSARSRLTAGTSGSPAVRNGAEERTRSAETSRLPLGGSPAAAPKRRRGSGGSRSGRGARTAGRR